MLRGNNEGGDSRYADGYVAMSFAGAIFRQADVPGAEDLFPAVAAHFNLELARGNDAELIDDVGVVIHLPVFPAQHPEAENWARRAPRVGNA